MNTDRCSLLTNYLREHYRRDVSIVVNVRSVCIIRMQKTGLPCSAGSVPQLNGADEFHPPSRRGDSVEVMWGAGTSTHGSIFHK